jgi:hypothetical protein
MRPRVPHGRPVCRNLSKPRGCRNPRCTFSHGEEDWSWAPPLDWAGPGGSDWGGGAGYNAIANADAIANAIVNGHNEATEGHFRGEAQSNRLDASGYGSGRDSSGWGERSDPRDSELENLYWQVETLKRENQEYKEARDKSNENLQAVQEELNCYKMKEDFNCFSNQYTREIHEKKIEDLKRQVERLERVKDEDKISILDLEKNCAEQKKQILSIRNKLTAAEEKGTMKRCGCTPAEALTGTLHSRFSPVISSDVEVKDGVTRQVSTRLQCITAMPAYRGRSLEELRLEDYRAPGRDHRGPAGRAAGPGQGGQHRQGF